MKASFLTLAFACLFSFATISETQATPEKINEVQQIVNPFEDIPVVVNGLPGTLDITSFTLVGGVLTAVGSLTSILGTFPVQIPVTNLSSTCSILHLELGPVDLNLLGLLVHLDQVV